MVKEIPVIPANDPRVGTNIHEAAVDRMRGNRVKSTAYVEKGDKAVRLVIDASLDIIDKGGSGGLRGAVTSEAVLVWVKRAKPDALVHVPGAEPLQGLEKIVGKGNGTVGGRVRVGHFAGFGKEDNHALLPETGVYWR